MAQLTAIQGALYAYICVLLGGPRDAADVLQETNLVLWRRAHEFDVEQNFAGLAHRVAYIQVLAHRKKQTHDSRMFSFNENALEAIASRLETVSDEFAHRIRLLDECVEKLPNYQRQLIHLRYAEKLRVKTISRRVCKSEDSVSAALHRARLSLAGCMEATPERGDGP